MPELLSADPSLKAIQTDIEDAEVEVQAWCASWEDFNCRTVGKEEEVRELMQRANAIVAQFLKIHNSIRVVAVSSFLEEDGATAQGLIDLCSKMQNDADKSLDLVLVGIRELRDLLEPEPWSDAKEAQHLN